MQSRLGQTVCVYYAYYYVAVSEVCTYERYCVDLRT